jgi:hypothetical protein
MGGLDFGLNSAFYSPHSMEIGQWKARSRSFFSGTRPLPTAGACAYDDVMKNPAPVGDQSIDPNGFEYVVVQKEAVSAAEINVSSDIPARAVV